MNVAIYTRVSTEEQAREGYSLEVQREYLESFAGREGHKVFQVYCDDGISGYTSDRPELQKLFKDAKSKKFGVVLVYKIDRFSRNLRDLLNLVDELSSYGVGFKSATELFDTTNSAGKLMFQQLGSFAEFERNRIAERVFPGMVKGVKNGNWQGGRYSPYGYLYNKGEKLLEIVPEEAEIVRMMYVMYLSGQSTTQIAGFLYSKGYKTRSGGKFHTKLVGSILKNQIYLGKLVWNTHHYDKTQKTLKGLRYVRNDKSEIIEAEGKHEPIIAQAVYDAVQKKLELSRKGMGVRGNHNDYILTGILYCDRCGHRFQGCNIVSSRENGRTAARRRYYRCSGRATHYIDCNNGVVRADEAEQIIFRVLETIFSGDIDEARLQLLVKRNTVGYSDSVRQDITDVKSKLDTNLSKQLKLSEIFSEGLLAKEAYKEQILPLREEERDLKRKIKRLELTLIEKENSLEYKSILKSVIRHIESIKAGLDVTGKKGLLRLVFKSVMVENGKIKGFELFEPFKSLYEGVRIQCQVMEKQRIMTIPESVSTCALSVVR